MRTEESGTLILTRRDVRGTLDMGDCIEAVERAFHLFGSGQAVPPSVASVHVDNGAFHTKAGVLRVGGRSYFAAKTNGNFPGNPARNGLPTVQGTLVLCDAERGSPLAMMDANEITALRTAAATAVAARHLMRNNASKLAIIGCGLQGHMHVDALSCVMTLDQVRLFDTNEEAATTLARNVEERFKISASVATSPASATQGVDVCVTCTTSTQFILYANDVDQGMFVAGVGVDSERKKELAPDLLKRSRVIVDVLAQCAAFGDLHHALDAGLLEEGDVYGELGEVVAGRKPGRESDDQVIVFDSTGMALQDVAAAALVYERASETGRGTRLILNN